MLPVVKGVSVSGAGPRHFTSWSVRLGVYASTNPARMAYLTMLAVS